MRWLRRAKGVRRYSWLIALTALFTGVSHMAESQTWPQKPIRVIVPFGAGSIIDTVPRVVFNQVSAQLHVAIIIENRPGAGSTIGAAMAAKSEPDGYTLFVNSNALAIAASVYPHLSYSAARDFSAIIPLGVTTNVLVISPAKGIRTLREFVDAAKTGHRAFTFATLGAGSVMDMSAERFRFSAGFEATQVPFRGALEALTEVAEGRVDYCFCAIGTVLPFIRDGRLLALAVSVPNRSALLPDVPTTLEAGFANSDFTFWLGVFAPANTPRDVILKLNREIRRALQLPAVHEKLAKLGIEPFVMSSSEFDAYVKHEINIDASLVKAIGSKAN